MRKFSPTEKDEIIADFMRDFDLAYSAETRNREEMVDDLKFAALDQWPDEVKQQRADRPMLTLDHVGQAVRKVMGGLRQNMPSIKVDPVDDGADPETADVLEDLTRQIEQSSNARNCYLNAASFQVKCGYGVWRVTTKENSDDVFQQDICIKAVANPFTCYFDPDAVMPQKQDGRFAIVSNVMSRKAYEAEHGKAEVSSIPNQGTGESFERWYSHDSIRIGEYFVKRKKKQKITQLSDGSVVPSEEITEDDIALYQQQGITPVRERTVDRETVEWFKLSAFDIIDHREWPGTLFPIIPVYGESENIEGETFVRGIVRAAKDPQRMYNYWNSAAAEMVALQPKAPFVVTAEQIKNHKHFWEKANTANLPYLPYEPDGSAPPPQRQPPPAIQSGLLQQASISAQDIQQATGVFEASTGALPDQRSGRAVIALQQEADLGTSLFMDNLAGAIEHTGRIILELIPKYYDTQRVVRLRGEDDAVRFAEINKPMLTADGMRILNDLSRGRYDVRVGVGPGYKTRRAEAASSMVELARVFPQILSVAGDLVAKNLDWPGADDLAERLKKLLPPGIAPEEDEDPEVQQQRAQQAQMAQQALQLEQLEQQAKTDNLKADTLVKLTTAQQNEIENGVSLAQTAMEQQNPVIAQQALAQVAELLQSA